MPLLRVPRPGIECFCQSAHRQDVAELGMAAACPGIILTMCCFSHHAAGRQDLLGESDACLQKTTADSRAN